MRTISLTLFVFLLAGITYSQTPAAKAPARPTIETNVDEVSIDIVVRTKKNKPVLDLKPTDLAVTDDGTPAQVSDLRVVSGETASLHQITLLFDQLDPSAANNARSIATKILKMVPERGFDISVLWINGRLRLFQEFTANRDAVRKAVNVVTDENTSSWPDVIADAEKRLIGVVQGAAPSGSQVTAQEREMGRVLLTALENSRQNLNDLQMPPSLADLQALSRAQQALPGRKVLIYFTQGVQANASTGDQLRAIAAAANRSGVSIYIINANGIDMRDYQSLMQTMVMGESMSVRAMNRTPDPATVAPSTGGFSSVDPPGLKTAVNDSLGRFEAEGMKGHEDPLAALAANTGGSYVSSNQSFRKPIKEMISDLSTYYEMSYIPPVRDYDGTFHPVNVVSARKDLKIHSRAGYFALPPNDDLQVRLFEAPILKAFGEAQLPSDLKLQAKVLQLGNLPEGGTSALVVEAPLSQMSTRDDANTNLYSLHAAIVAEIKNQAGAVVDHFSKDLPQRAALNTKESTRSEFITLQRDFALQPGKYTLEAAVMDRYSEKIGAVRQDFEVIGPSDGPSLSDVILVRRFDPLSDETDAFEPLTYKHGKVVPDLSGQVEPGAKDISLFFLVHPDAGISAPAMLEMQVMRNGGLVGEVPLQMPSSSNGEAIPYLAAMRTSSLAPGNYQVTETLTQGDKISERTMSFNIGGPELASAPGAIAKPDPKDVEAVSDASLEEGRIASHQTPHLEITSLPADSVTRPSPEVLDSLITGAREHALSYSKGLPNFVCVEMTDRSIDPSGNGRWKHKDSFAELLRFRDKHESRTTIAVNGIRSSENRENMDPGAISLGEFGDMLGMVFEPTSKADFQWKETDELGGSKVQVLSYKVARENGSMTLRGANGAFYAGFHGLVYIDSSTYGIRRVTMEADALPEDSSIRAAAITVEYDYVAVGTHDYLMPVRGNIRLHKGKHESDMNEVVFQNYRRYASEAKVIAP